jgi:bifunctional UDP-N-acetylglucosamine pyrophosphorylase/glucosamine-1-phosphate N-acetyltransferase
MPPVAHLTVLVLAAGQGTRMRSATPKVLHEVLGRPMVLWPVAAAHEAGASRVIVVGGPDRALEPVLPEGAELADQPEANGTAGAVAAALEHIDPAEDTAPVVVLSGDVPLVTAETVGAIAQAHAQSGADATVVTMELDDPAGYGRVVRDANGDLERIVETKKEGDATPEQLAIREVNTGVYVFSPGPLAETLPEVGSDNAQGERYLPDVLPLLPRVNVHVVDDPSLTLGVNDRADLAAVTQLARRRVNTAHMRAGVTFLDPETAYVDATVTIGQDTEIGPNVTLRGATAIGAGCTLVANVVAVDAELRDGATVGPFAYLRPGTLLREKAKAGTYVELKNADIGPGAKVPHLSYIGDADVGEGTNLGAATITANYDGRNKHRTTIGARVRSAVDTTFVAPVTVGDDAYTAAGSVITQDVPEGALGVARSRQRNVEGYAERANSGERPATGG